MDPRLANFYKQYMQQLDEPSFPPSHVLLELSVQDQIFQWMFKNASDRHLPPVRFQRRILKALTARIESAITDPNEDEISDSLMQRAACLSSTKAISPLEAAQEKSIVSYCVPSPLATPAWIYIEEAHNLIFAAGTTGFRVWESCLHIGYFLATYGLGLIQNRNVLELGAGAGLLSILAAGPLKAAHVIATDGDTEVVATIERNVRLNGKTLLHRAVHGNPIEARLLDWSDRLSVKELLEHQLQEHPPDIVLGADIIYDTDLLEPLLAALTAVQEVRPAADILISAPIRKEETFESFIDACHRRNFLVSDVPFKCPPIQEQLGFYHKTTPPIKIVKLTQDLMAREAG